jgi:hypothetical protein
MRERPSDVKGELENLLFHWREGGDLILDAIIQLPQEGSEMMGEEGEVLD